MNMRPKLTQAHPAKLPAFIGGGSNNYIASSGTLSVICGGLSNVDSSAYSFIGGGGSNLITNEGKYNVIAGGRYNKVDSTYAVVGGGHSNEATEDYSTIGGGRNNTASGLLSTVGGGGHATAALGNTASGDYSTVCGGYSNNATARDATVGGGDFNDVTGYGSTVAGGHECDVAGKYSDIAGGYYNYVGGASDSCSAILGGCADTINGTYSAIPGGYHNVVSADYSLAFGRSVSVSDNYVTAFYDTTYPGMVSVNRPSPHSTLHYNGSEASAYETTDTSYALGTLDHTLFTTGEITVTLPSGSTYDGRIYYIRNTDTDAADDVTLDVVGGGGSIERGVNYIIQNDTGVIVQSDGTNWWIIADY